MEPGYSYNRDSFFTANGCEKILHGLEIWRGYFQSLRAGQGRMYLNLDISTAMMYQPGPLIDLCLKFFGREGSPNILAPNSGFDQRRNRELAAFLTGIVVASQTQAGPRVTFRVEGLSARAANQETFSTETNGQTATVTVATYFANTNRPLQYPNIVCVKVSSSCL
jgi:eukaryotic translation initiation factor 2C